MNRTFIALLLLCAPSAFAVDACPGVSGGSCLITTAYGTNCLDAITNTIPIQVLQAQCSAATGSVFSTSSCPTAGVVGSCVINSQGREGVVMRTYSPLTADQSAMICNQSHSRVCQ